MTKSIMFEVIFLDECTYRCRSVEEVYDIISTFHGSFVFANYIKSICTNAKPGDKFVYKDDGLIIECK